MKSSYGSWQLWFHYLLLTTVVVTVISLRFFGFFYDYHTWIWMFATITVGDLLIHKALELTTG